MITPLIMSPVKWLGGKARMAAKIASLLPQGRVYCEPFGGAASLLWRRKPSPVEVYNDMDGNLVNLFRALQDVERAQRLHNRLALTLYSRTEFGLALDIMKAPESSPDDRAWAFYVAQNQGFGGQADSVGNWGQSARSHNGMGEQQCLWWSRFDSFEFWHGRIARVQIDNRDGMHVLRYWDASDAVFYLDPPYVPDTRVKGTEYAHEVDADYHVALVDLILTMRGAVALSGYPSPVYDRLTEAGWDCRTWRVTCGVSGSTSRNGLKGAGSKLDAQARTEALWRNPRCLDMNNDNMRLAI